MSQLRIPVTIRSQIILLLSATLGVSLVSYISIGTSLVIRDKESYIYDHSLSQVQAVSGVVESRIHGAEVMVRTTAAVFATGLSSEQIQFFKKNFSSQSQLLGVRSVQILEWDPQRSGEQGIELLHELGTSEPNWKEYLRKLSAMDLFMGRNKDSRWIKTKEGELAYLLRLGTSDKKRATYAMVVQSFETALFDGVSKDMMIRLLDSDGALVIGKAADAFLDAQPERWKSLDSELRATQFASGVTDQSLSGSDYIVGYRKIVQQQLMIASSIQKDVAYQAARQLLQRSVVLGLSILFMAVGLGLLVVKGLTSRLRALWEATKKIAQGDFSTRVSAEGFFKDEVVDLAHSFNSMSGDITVAREQLEDYAKNLEQKVKDRTAELNYANRLLSAILNSLGQGFLIFDQKQKCLPIFSKACNDLLESNPSGKSISEVMKVPPSEKELFDDWSTSLFQNLLPFEDMVGLGPKSFEHSKGKKIDIEYYPMTGDQKADLEGVVVVATDRTREYEAKHQAQKEREYARMIIKLAKDKELFVSFVEAARKLFEDMRQECLLDQPDREAMLRGLHTIKGSAANFSIEGVVHLAHELESELVSLKEASPEVQAQFYKRFVSTGLPQLKDELKNFFEKNSEIIGRSFDETERHIELSVSDLVSFSEEMKNANSIDLLRKNFITRFIHEPVLKYLTHYDELARDIAKKQGKQVSPLEFHTHEMTVVGEIYQDLFSTLVHAFRNAVDHGIETAEDRVQAGKKPQGKIIVETHQVASSSVTGTDLFIRIQDDGKGISPEAIRKKLRSQGREELALTESDEQVIQHVFDSGLSTRESVSELSGRGVGMDAILTEAKKLGGSARVQSIVGKGTLLEIRVPWFEEAPQKKDKIALKKAS